MDDYVPRSLNIEFELEPYIVPGCEVADDNQSEEEEDILAEGFIPPATPAPQHDPVLPAEIPPAPRKPPKSRRVQLDQVQTRSTGGLKDVDANARLPGTPVAQQLPKSTDVPQAPQKTRKKVAEFSRSPIGTRARQALANAGTAISAIIGSPDRPQALPPRTNAPTTRAQSRREEIATHAITAGSSSSTRMSAGLSKASKDTAGSSISQIAAQIPPKFAAAGTSKLPRPVTKNPAASDPIPTAASRGRQATATTNPHNSKIPVAGSTGTRIPSGKLPVEPASPSSSKIPPAPRPRNKLPTIRERVQTRSQTAAKAFPAVNIDVPAKSTRSRRTATTAPPVPSPPQKATRKSGVKVRTGATTISASKPALPQSRAKPAPASASRAPVNVAAKPAKATKANKARAALQIIPERIECQTSTHRNIIPNRGDSHATGTRSRVANIETRNEPLHKDAATRSPQPIIRPAVIDLPAASAPAAAEGSHQPPTMTEQSDQVLELPESFAVIQSASNMSSLAKLQILFQALTAQMELEGLPVMDEDDAKEASAKSFTPDIAPAAEPPASPKVPVSTVPTSTISTTGPLDGLTFDGIIVRNKCAIVSSWTQISTGRKVVAKDIIEQGASSTIIQEARAMKALKECRWIPEFLDDFWAKNDPPLTHRAYVLLMERCSMDLEDYRYNRGITTPITEEEVRFIALQIVLGLEYLHARGFIHGDIKPANILVNITTAENLKNVKISDLGTVVQAAKTPHMTGTHGYIPLEVYDQGYNTSVSDWFSVGATLFDITTGGNLPFGNDDDEDILKGRMRRNKMTMWRSSVTFSDDSFEELMLGLLELDENLRLGNGFTEVVSQHEFFEDALSFWSDNVYNEGDGDEIAFMHLTAEMDPQYGDRLRQRAPRVRILQNHQAAVE
ncbi:Beta-adrenergic receptor kinase 2 [Phlyctochytrium planicorne]|nr:Beta-adrenergic receptor kinase 2 [Phlyctochytrium planicorne]